MITKNLEWLVLNALHGDVSGENPDDLRRIIIAKDELNSLSVRHSALQARHNALCDAVAWERECEAVAHWQYEVWELAPCGSGHNKIYSHAAEIHAAARTEVDRLLAEEK